MGQLAYEAYYIFLGGIDPVTGHPLPRWVELPTALLPAWEASADAVKAKIFSVMR